MQFSVETLLKDKKGFKSFYSFVIHLKKKFTIFEHNLLKSVNQINADELRLIKLNIKSNTFVRLSFLRLSRPLPPPPPLSSPL